MSSETSAKSKIRQRAQESALIPTYVGRQPMFDGNLETRSFELLFRHNLDNWCAATDSDWATGQTFWNAFIELGQDHVAEGQRAYINVTPAFLRSDCVELFPRDRLALELTPTEFADASLKSVIESLRDGGYRMVMDAGGPDSIDGAMLELVDELKIDVRDVELDSCKALIAEAHERDITPIAKYIERFEIFESCRSAGFQVFQGQFLAKPQIIVGGRPPADGLARMRLLAAVNDEESGLEKLTEVISQDVGLTYKLLHYVNSAMFAFRTEIDSIQHAIMILGLRWMRTWTNLVILAGVTDKPSAIFNTAVIRGKMCEALAAQYDKENPESFFTVGLLSVLDCLLGIPMESILAELPLSPELEKALTKHESELGEALRCTLRYEQSAWDDVTFGDLTPAEIRDCYVTALQWAAELRGTL